MWVPVITIAWSIFYLVQSRLRQTKALNNSVSGNLKGIYKNIFNIKILDF